VVLRTSSAPRRRATSVFGKSREEIVMKLPRRRLLQLAAGAAALPATSRIARAQPASWQSLGGGLTSAPAICSWGSGRLDVFARGEDFALWHKRFTDGSWSDWESLGGGLSSPPAAVSWGEGRIDVFVRGNDRALWHKWFTDSNWSDWESLGGVLNFGPAVSSWGPGRLDVFARGTDNTVFQRSFDEHNWIAWTPISEPWTRAALPGIAAVSGPFSGAGRIDLLMWAVSTSSPRNTYLVHKSYCAGRWNDSFPIGDILAVPAAPESLSTSLAVASWQFPSVDWFVRGAGNVLEHSAGYVHCGGDVSVLQMSFGPTSRGGVLTSGPAAVGSRSRTIDVVVRGTDNALWHTSLLSGTPN
jgi:hypothetical protein